MTEIIRVSRFLRYVLFADAATCLACGLLLAICGGFLENLLGLPASLMFYAGLSLFPFAAFLLYAATRKSISKTIVWLIVSLNLLWTIVQFFTAGFGLRRADNLRLRFRNLSGFRRLDVCRFRVHRSQKSGSSGFRKDAKETVQNQIKSLAWNFFKPTI